jgi:hypothetical protein
MHLFFLSSELKGLSGYELYFIQTMPEVIMMANLTPKERLIKIRTMWKALSENERAEWELITTCL